MGSVVAGRIARIGAAGVGPGSAGPQLGVLGHGWVDEWGPRVGDRPVPRQWAPGLRARPVPAGPGRFVDAGGGVHAPLDPFGPAGADLVGERVAEALHRPHATDRVPVAVEEPVQGPEVLAAVAAQERQAHGAQVDAVQRLRPRRRRRHRRFVHARPSPDVVVRPPAVQHRAQPSELVEAAAAPPEQVLERAVDLAQLRHLLGVGALHVGPEGAASVERPVEDVVALELLLGYVVGGFGQGGHVRSRVPGGMARGEGSGGRRSDLRPP